jgi:hypothetical protein
MMVEVRDYTALLSGSSASAGPGKGAFITWSFSTEFPEYLRGSYTSAQIDSFRQPNAEFQARARQAVDAFRAASGLVFLEVPANLGGLPLSF